MYSASSKQWRRGDVGVVVVSAAKGRSRLVVHGQVGLYVGLLFSKQETLLFVVGLYPTATE